MGSLSNYAENALLDHVLKVSALSVPANIYIALSTTDPTEDGSGISEPVGNNYSRIQCNSWSAGANRRVSNSSAVSIATPSGSWGVIGWAAIYDAIAGGNMLAHGALSAPRTIGLGSVMTFDVGAIVVSFSTGGISNYLAHKLLDHLFKTASFTVPTNIYVGYALGTITDAMSGSSISEPTDAAYARQAHNTWVAASGGATSNDGAVTFPTATANQGSITYNFTADALTGGNLLTYALASHTIASGDDPSIASGGMDVVMT